MNRVWSGMSGPSQVDERWRVRVEEGACVTFEDGRSCVDANSGLWNVSLGYGHPRVVEAIRTETRSLSYGGQFRRGSALAERVAERLLSMWPQNYFGRVMFGTSGSASNDMLIKLARFRNHRLGNAQAMAVASFSGSYHGATLGALGLTDEYLFQPEVLLSKRGLVRLSPRSADAVAATLARQGENLAAIFVEPVQGTGSLAISDEILREIFAARARHGFLVIADEVATGFGRTGIMFRSSAWPEPPDIVLLSKGLTNGTMAASAALVSSPVAEIFENTEFPFLHGETQAGCAFSCAAISGVLDVFEQDLGMSTCDARLPGAGRLLEMLAGLDLERFGASFRGEGYFMTVDIPELPSGCLPLQDLRDRGLVVQGGVRGFQLAPPYVMSDANWEFIAQTIHDYVSDMFRRRP